MNNLKINTLETATKVPFNLDGKIMFGNSSVEIIHLTLKPSEKLDKHTNPADAVFYVLSGKGILFYDDKKIEVSANSCFEIKKEIKRGWENTNNSELKLLVVKQLVVS